MDYNLNNIVRSVAVIVVGLPLSLGMNEFLSASTNAVNASIEKSDQSRQYETLRASLTQPCLEYLFSDVDSKLERTAKNTIDDQFGGSVDYKGVCNWIIK